ncbi:LANO_0E12002g1_1 [Lachancea nothofagi CBS 11611]|uniref:LANO_0E12002g1_1 n=1 Tax=Lachancea nothofagi CBS 11611 TaxID=1266666 RepID=A0A1G4JXU5_9SACH|nr:LANO_0E12002g1_1 [Lachancea nothofagi CBS 11611]
MASKKTLKEILDSEYVEDSDDDGKSAQDATNSATLDTEEETVDRDYCIDCKDMKTEIICRDCEEQYCVVCFEMIHRSGRRKKHEYVKTSLEQPSSASDEQEQQQIQDSRNEAAGIDTEEAGQKNNVREMSNSDNSMDQKMLAMLIKHAKYIPMRLTSEERHVLRLLEAALHVSEYTDRVDIISYKSKAKRIVEQLKEMCSVLCGLVIASNLKIGKKLLEMKNFSDNSSWFQDVFEIGRRYKIMNPEKMRDTYGKLCYMIMDSRLPQIEDHMEFHLFKPISTVYDFLNSRTEDGQALKLFEDKLILYATSQVSPVGKARGEINRLIRQKETAIEKLASRYSNKYYSKDDIRQVLYSIGDYNAYINMNRRPVIRMLERLEAFQNPDIASQYSIGIQYGRNGARLTHDHFRQMQYVQQSLTLWSCIQREMIHLWYIADQDLYSPQEYRLASTGQGLNRIKACPALYREMHKILNECRSKCDTWVGSSVVHLGDDAVPNALFFLDKYTQVPNILIPFDQALLKINDLVKEDPALLQYIESEYGSTEDLKLTILQDAFAHMFDGSGADNFYMSGSCIDGRLTSAWNHTNAIAKKKYYKIFLMTGFIGFNGQDGF